MAQCANLSIYQGDDYAATVNVFNIDGTDADLTGYTARAQIRTGAADSTAVVAELTTTIQLPNIISLALAHEVTATLKQAYVWDLELTDTVGTVITVLTGDVEVTLEVTRATAA